MFGNIVEVTAREYVEAIDKCDPRVFVVVHIYEDYVKECGRLNRCMEELARSYTNVKFVRLRSSESPSPFDPVTLPTLCVYKAGDLCNSFVRVQDTVSSNFTSDDIEWMLNQVWERRGGGGESACLHTHTHTHAATHPAQEGVFESKQSGIIHRGANVSENFVGGTNGNEYRARFALERETLMANFSDEEDSDFEN